jgi:DNA-binding NarL/FixJ family response regulator
VAESDAETAGRLFGASEASRRRLGCVRVPPDESWLRALRSEAQAALGTAKWTLVWSEGESLSLEEAAAYAARGRGKRLRPLGGWDSLTPTEAEVARLAADGLSNPQIGERMFISRGTVKTHVARIYDKLGVCNRTELARAAARQRLTQS